MPVLRSRAQYSSSPNGKSGRISMLSRAGRSPSVAERLDPKSSSRRRINALEQERVRLTAKLAQHEQDNRALNNRLQAQSLKLEDLCARYDEQATALTTATARNDFLADRLFGADCERKHLLDTTTKVQRAILYELRALMRIGVRFDVKDVQDKHSRISTKELNAQLEWHRVHRGRIIPNSGGKGTKVARWAKAVQDYATEVEERLAMVPILGEYPVDEYSESAMSVDGTSVHDDMDID